MAYLPPPRLRVALALVLLGSFAGPARAGGGGDGEDPSGDGEEGEATGDEGEATEDEGEATGGEGAEAEPPRRRKMALVPSIGYNPDDGLGLGIFGDVVRLPLDGDDRPHVSSVGFRAIVQLKPGQVGWESQLGLSWFPRAHGNTEARFSVTTQGRNWDWWFGLGQGTVRDRSVDTTDDRVPDAHHRFRNYRIRTDTRLLRRLSGPLSAFGGLTLTMTWIGVHDDTLLARDAAAGGVSGVDGGPTLGLDTGLRVDGRNDRADPTRGGLLCGMAQLNVGPGRVWGRALFDLRGYLGAPSGRVVLAGELLVQAALGDVPFYEQGVILGFELRDRTMTGERGARGLDRGRLRGPYGALGHLELRVRPPGLRLFHWLFLRLAPVVWVDAVRVDGPDRFGDDPPLQPGFGGGVRLSFNEVTVTRLDIGTAPEAMLTPDGEETRWTFAIYATLGHAF